jgi:hypothetical protein
MDSNLEFQMFELLTMSYLKLIETIGKNQNLMSNSKVQWWLEAKKLIANLFVWIQVVQMSTTIIPNKFNTKLCVFVITYQQGVIVHDNTQDSMC